MIAIWFQVIILLIFQYPENSLMVSSSSCNWAMISGVVPSGAAFSLSHWWSRRSLTIPEWPWLAACQMGVGFPLLMKLLESKVSKKYLAKYSLPVRQTWAINKKEDNDIDIGKLVNDQWQHLPIIADADKLAGNQCQCPLIN